ncbi:FRG domain-containing protein [Arthrobacter sp. LAPM80]|uniref:FRG domain-containing protein n=1 Tax=Arthrobacter sp. LAPM80 TaxID=3141788 RepID=UPI00398AE144
MTKIEVKSVTEFFKVIGEFADRAGPDPLWFRGTGSEKYKLAPSLYRHPSAKTIEKLLDVENRLIERFRQRSVPFLMDRHLSDDWEFLFLMQHYDVPTRLLDWSESAMVALWFALNSKAKDREFASVWTLNPTKWNQKVFEFQSYRGGIMSISDLQLLGYKPGAGATSMNTMPAAIYGTHNSPRIVAQRGAFTIAGSDLTALEETEAARNVDGLLSRIVIMESEVPIMQKQLSQTGFTESMVFPDLPGLARELSSMEGFSNV